MNPFKEYTNLIKRGVLNADKIVEGLSNKALKRFNLLNEEDRNIIEQRMDICLNCPYNSNSATTSEEYLALTGEHYTTSRPELHCSLCGCILDLKTSSLSSNCGIEFWNEENEQNPEKQLPLKWTSKPTH